MRRIMEGMGTATLLSIEEYLGASYEPDCDYVDGRLEERNVGERDHSSFQAEFSAYLIARKKQWGIRTYTEQRVRVSGNRVRIPDVCVIAGPKPEERVFSSPPFICLEILSEDDRLNRVQARLDDYLSFGVPHIWLVDPIGRRAWTYTKQGLLVAQDRILRASDPDVMIVLDEVFAEMD